MSAAVLTPDLCVIGAGSGGLSVAAGAVQMGASVVLVEKGRMGGDCLNYGCVPSKALLAAAHAAADARRAAIYGVEAGDVRVDFARVMGHVRDVIAGIAPHDSQERFEDLGCTVIRAPATFCDGRRLEAGNHVIRPRRVVVATGSRPRVPDLPGIDSVSVLTNETVFDLTEPPEHLLILGGGPIGTEMASAFLGLGVPVTLATRGTLLPKDDPELRAVVRDRLRAEGLELYENADVAAVEPGDDGGGVLILSDGRRLAGSHLLVAVGRTPAVESLNLEMAGVAYTQKGVTVDARLRTTNRRVYAIGDAAGGPLFTHRAGYDAGIVVRNVLFRLPAKAKHALVPWVTYSDPELAQVGLTEAEARARHGDSVRVFTESFADNDRARAERRTEGRLKLVTGKTGKVLGCGIVGPRAGDLIQPWVLAVSQGMKVGPLATMIAPYPTLGEISKRAAGAFYTPRLFGDGTRRVVRFLARFG